MDASFFLGAGGDAGGFPSAPALAGGGGRSLKRRHPDSGGRGGAGGGGAAAAGGASGAALRVARAAAAGAPHPAAAAAVEGVPLHRSKGKGGGFQSLGLSQPVLSGILRLGYKLPTPIQRRALPLALTGRDLVAMARTGSGKTAAFLIPMVERLVNGPRAAQRGVRAVLLSPTRELALQTLKFATKLAKFTDLKCTSLVGGESLGAQFAALAEQPDVLVATPGRLMHLLREVPGFHLRAVQYVCFDEADRLFELGFAEQLREILGRMPEQRQTLLFSATLPSALIAFAKAGLRDPQLVRLDVETKVSEDLGLAFFTTHRDEKPAALLWLLRAVVPSDQQAIVFVATRHHSEFLATLLQRCDVAAQCVYGSQDMETRKGNLEAFRTRSVRVLVVTDVAARGLDIPLLDNVINYDFPDKAKLFVHRVGRVARQGRSGCAFSLVTSSDLPYMLDVLLFLGFPASNVYIREGMVVSAREAPLGAEEGEGGEEGGGESVSGGSSGEEEEAAAGGAKRARSGAAGASAAAAAAAAAADAAGAADAPRLGGRASSVVSRGGVSVTSRVHSIAKGAATRSVGGGTAVTNAVRFDEGEGYPLAQLRGDRVHYGQLPRGPLELEAETTRALLARDIELRKLHKSQENAMQLYLRTRVAASKRSAARASELEDDRVHPVLLSFTNAGDVEVRAYIAGLQAFRPQATILELEGGGKDRVGGSTAAGRRKAADRGAALMARKRAMHAGVLLPRVGSVSLGAAVLASAKGSGALTEEGIGLGLAGEIAGVAASMGERVEDMVARHRERQAKSAQRQAERLQEALASGRGRGSGGGGGGGGGGEGSSGEEGQGSAGEGGSDDDGGEEGEEDEEDAFMRDDYTLADSLLTTSAPAGKQRLSAAARRRLAKCGGAVTGPGGRPLPASAATAAASAAAEAAAEAAGALLKSQRRQLLRDSGLDAARDLFRSKTQFISLRSAADAINEAGYSAAGTLGARGEGMRGGKDTGDLADLVHLESAAMDLAGDEKGELGGGGGGGAGGGGKRRRVRYWDPIKKKYLLLDASEIGAGGRRKMSAVRNEAGQKVRVNEKKDGELYREWVKRTRAAKSGSGAGEGEGEGGVVDFTEEGEEGDGGGGGGGDGGGKGGKGGKGGAAGGGKGGAAGGAAGGGLRTAKEMAAERMRKARSQGGKKRKGGAKWEGATVKLGRNGLIKRGGGLAPSRSKVLVKGKGISGFKGGRKGGVRGN